MGYTLTFSDRAKSDAPKVVLQPSMPPERLAGYTLTPEDDKKCGSLKGKEKEVKSALRASDRDFEVAYSKWKLMKTYNCTLAEVNSLAVADLKVMDKDRVQKLYRRSRRLYKADLDTLSLTGRLSIVHYFGGKLGNQFVLTPPTMAELLMAVRVKKQEAVTVAALSSTDGFLVNAKTGLGAAQMAIKAAELRKYVLDTFTAPITRTAPEYKAMETYLRGESTFMRASGVSDPGRAPLKTLLIQVLGASPAVGELKSFNGVRKLHYTLVCPTKT
jgi:hypothetical protein